MDLLANTKTPANTTFPAKPAAQKITIDNNKSQPKSQAMPITKLVTDKDNNTKEAKNDDDTSSNDKKTFWLQKRLAKHGIDLFGYIDTSYNYLSRSNRFTSGVPCRSNDSAENGFSLQQFSLTIERQPDQGFGFSFNPILGRDAYILTSYGMNPYFGIQNIGFTLQEAFVQYARDKFTFMLGKFNTIEGYELTNPGQNNNFSGSLEYSFIQPGTVTGIRAVYTPNDQLSYTIGVNDGWDNIRDWTRNKTIELGVNNTLNKYFNYAISFYGGQERADTLTDYGPLGYRYLLDIVATWNITDKFNIVANYDYALQTKAAADNEDDLLGRAFWTGIAGYLNYKINDYWKTSLRAEFFNDPQGYATGVPQNIREMTLSLGYTPIKNLLLRVETRRDVANTNSFLKKNLVGVSNNLQSFAFELYYSF